MTDPQPRMKPSIGRIVIHRGISMNGTRQHPAIITRVWDDETGEPSGPPGQQCSMPHFQSLLIDPDDGRESGWYWPLREVEATP